MGGETASEFTSFVGCELDAKKFGVFLFVCLTMLLKSLFMCQFSQHTCASLTSLAIDSQWLSTKLENNCYSSEMGKRAVALMPTT